jgi:hypothetical protein
VVAETLPDTLYVDAVRPFRVTLLTLCQALHARQALRMEDGPPTSLPWPDCAKRLGRLNIRELTDIVVASLTDRAWVLVLDQLEGVTPSMGPSLERLLGTACVLGATRALKPGMEKLWWAFDRIELAPLTREETRELLWAVADRDKLADPAMFEAKVLSQANGNPGIVISDATRRLVEGYFRLRLLGDLAVKGKSEPVQAWDVIAARAGRTRFEVEVERGLTPFVGRSASSCCSMSPLRRPRRDTGRWSSSSVSRGSASPGSSTSFAVSWPPRPRGWKGGACPSGARWRFIR